MANFTVKKWKKTHLRGIWISNHEKKKFILQHIYKTLSCDILMRQSIVEIIHDKKNYNMCNNALKCTKYVTFVLPFLSFFTSIFDDSDLKGNTHQNMIINI